MRRALGLGGGATQVHQQRPEQARQRHKFAQDGSVPVVMLNRHGDGDHGGAKDRIATLEAALEHERQAHAGTRRALADAQAAQQAAQTRLAHATLAHNEAIGTERQARIAAEQALAAAQAPAPPVIEPAAPPVMAAERPAAEPRKLPRIPRVKTAPERDQKPVRWWTPSYRSKSKA